MISNNILQIIIYFSVLLLLVKPTGYYIAYICSGLYENKSNIIIKILFYIEQKIYLCCGILPKQGMDWKTYAKAVLIFNFLGFATIYFIQRLQVFLPLNYQHFGSISPDVAFNTAASFITNTDWQAYVGEASLSCFSQMLGLTVQNFISAATGVAVLIALIRAINTADLHEIGNFWVDIIRIILYIFLPFSIILSLLLVSQGVPQNFKAYQPVELIQQSDPPQTGIATIKNNTINNDKTIIPMGPIASHIAIKQLGTNGGGYFNANSAHPFENPTPLTNFLEMLAIMLIPAALCYTLGSMIANTKQGWALLIAMLLILLPCSIASTLIEQHANPKLRTIRLNNHHDSASIYGSNMEGKEVRFGAMNSAFWSAITTATSNGSVNAMHDSFLPIGGLIPLWLINLGEIIFGGVGSGLYQMLIFVIITVFICGLMVGRTPEYLGKKIEVFEMKMASFAILIAPTVVLICTAIALTTKIGASGINNNGMHGLTEILYAFSSMANNNGSAFAGIKTNIFYNILGGISMLIGRYWIMIPTLAIAGSMGRKKIIPNSSATLPTTSWLFILILVGFIIIIGSLIFFPVFSLGPLIEHLVIWSINE